MALFQISIPVPNNLNFGGLVRHENLFFEGEKSPTQDQLIKVVSALHDNLAGFVGYDNLWKDCLRSILTAKGWVLLHENGSLIGDKVSCLVQDSKINTLSDTSYIFFSQIITIHKI